MNLHPFDKRKMFEALFTGGYVRVVVNPMVKGVLLPSVYMTSQHQVLDFGDAMSRPITDLVVSDAGLTGTLSYSGEPFFTTIPWAAVFHMESPVGTGATWQEDYTPALSAAVQQVVEANAAQEAPEAPKAPRATHLKSV
jgi:hypothetical protein